MTKIFTFNVFDVQSLDEGIFLASKTMSKILEKKQDLVWDMLVTLQVNKDFLTQNTESKSSWLADSFFKSRPFVSGGRSPPLRPSAQVFTIISSLCAPLSEVANPCALRGRWYQSHFWRCDALHPKYMQLQKQSPSAATGTWKISGIGFGIASSTKNSVTARTAARTIALPGKQCSTPYTNIF